jgi:hypothetical protein
MQRFRIEGELRASDLVIGEGAEIQGTAIAQDVTVSGTVKGTIRAVRVILQGGNVEGDIFNRTLSIDENSVFEGASRRDENPTEQRTENGTQPSSSVVAKASHKKFVESPPLSPSSLPSTDTMGRVVERPVASRLPRMFRAFRRGDHWARRPIVSLPRLLSIGCSPRARRVEVGGGRLEGARSNVLAITSVLGSKADLSTPERYLG